MKQTLNIHMTRMDEVTMQAKKFRLHKKSLYYEIP